MLAELSAHSAAGVQIRTIGCNCSIHIYSNTNIRSNYTTYIYNTNVIISIFTFESVGGA
jgi:hypothetical protein